MRAAVCFRGERERAVWLAGEGLWVGMHGIGFGCWGSVSLLLGDR